jgi:hypothetical protein
MTFGDFVFGDTEGDVKVDLPDISLKDLLVESMTDFDELSDYNTDDADFVATALDDSIVYHHLFLHLFECYSNYRDLQEKVEKFEKPEDCDLIDFDSMKEDWLRHLGFIVVGEIENGLTKKYGQTFEYPFETPSFLM